MPSIRDELCRYVYLSAHGQIVQHPDKLDQLEERFGDGVIPGLVECLTDGDSAVRMLAVQLLTALRPRSDSAIPALIERMADEDWLVVVAVINALRDFGPLAAAAIPQVECWLQSPKAYLRLMAAITIVKLHPSRTEFLPQIWDATNSDDLVVQSFAREFFSEAEDSDL